MFNPNFKVYIIGNFLKSHYLEVIEDYSRAKEKLELLGFEVIDPVDFFLKNEYSYNITRQAILSKLLESDAVYILSDVKIDLINNIEIKTALKLQLYFFFESNLDTVSY